MDWRKIRDENFHPIAQKEQKEQKQGEEVPIATIADIAPKCRKVKSHNPNQNPAVLCPYKGRERWVSWPVCEWHRELNDPECQDCRPKLKIKKKEIRRLI